MKQEKRFIEIISCEKCIYSGHTYSGHAVNMEVTYICSNPDHLDLDVPKRFLDRTAYPIVMKGHGNVEHFIPIPSWCNLPKPSQ
jgi:hypothetical protein